MVKISTKSNIKRILIITVAFFIIVGISAAASNTTNSSEISPSNNSQTKADEKTGDNDKVSPKPVSSTEICLPSKVYAVVGKEVNIYFENVLNDKAEKYDFTVNCSIGKHMNDRWTCKPTKAGTYPLSIDVYEQNTLICSASTNVVVSEVNSDGSNKTFLAIGDSTTSGGIYTGEILKMAKSDKVSIALTGSKGEGSNKYEGISGWTVAYFYESSKSPFVFNGAFDFGKYLSTNKLHDPGFVLINLGINDVLGFNNDSDLNKEIPSILEKLNSMIENIKTYNTGIRIGIAVTIPPSKDQDAFGESYKCEITQWRYKRNNFIWNKALINAFQGKEAQGIDLVPINVNLDTVHNMQTTEEAINSRNPNLAEHQSNGVHPGFKGYYQIADEIYYWLRSH